MPSKTIAAKLTGSGVSACCCGCNLTMRTILIDGSTTNYANLTDAADAILNKTAGCLVESSVRTDFLLSRTFSASITTNVLNVSDAALFSGAPGSANELLIRAYLLASAGLAITWNVSESATLGPTSLGGQLYADDGTTLIDSFSNSIPSSGSYTLTVPTDGYYYFRLSAQCAISPIIDNTLTLSFTADGGASAKFCTVRAAYDDGSGGTLYDVC